LSEQSEQSEQNPENLMNACFLCSDIFKKRSDKLRFVPTIWGNSGGFMFRLTTYILRFAASFNAKIRRGIDPVATLPGGQKWTIMSYF
jgi:hypothetical protein